MDNSVGSKVNIEKLLSEGKTVEVPITGFSMYPLLSSKRDRVVICPVKDMKVKRGDVVLFRRSGEKLVLHRLYNRNEAGYFFAGDNEYKKEGPVAKAQLRGVMTAFVRNGRRYSVKNPAYIVYFRLWMFLLPIRPFIAKTVHGIKCLFNAGGREKTK